MHGTVYSAVMMPTTLGAFLLLHSILCLLYSKQFSTCAECREVAEDSSSYQGSTLSMSSGATAAWRA